MKVDNFVRIPSNDRHHRGISCAHVEHSALISDLQREAEIAYWRQGMPPIKINERMRVMTPQEARNADRATRIQESHMRKMQKTIPARRFAYA